MNRFLSKMMLGVALLMLSVASAHAQQIQCSPSVPGSCQQQGLNFPQCYVCQTVVGGPNVCVPDDSFCDDISGGNAANDCRSAVCVASPVPDPSVNPTGCDYTLTPDANPDECLNCSPVGQATLENCGNGICEPDEGEDCGTCSSDCRLPGFDGATCPLPPTDPIFSEPFKGVCDESGIVFDGPPYNQVRGFCEDGDICTNDACTAVDGYHCESTPKNCSINTADFCCPAGCNPPPVGATCGPNDSGCDVDCYIPESCEPTPLPIPTPTPRPPAFVGCLEGSGVHGSGSGPGCKGFSCSLDPMMATDAASFFGTSALALVALASGLLLRRRQR